MSLSPIPLDVKLSSPSMLTHCKSLLIMLPIGTTWTICYWTPENLKHVIVLPSENNHCSTYQYKQHQYQGPNFRDSTGRIMWNSHHTYIELSRKSDLQYTQLLNSEKQVWENIAWCCSIRREFSRSLVMRHKADSHSSAAMTKNSLSDIKNYASNWSILL